MIELPPITFQLFDIASQNISHEDKEIFNHYKKMYMSLMKQYSLKMIYNKENHTKKSREKLCERDRKMSS
jgi:hypothetical protein